MVDINKSENTKKWKISDKFISYDFANFLQNAFPIEENNTKKESTSIIGWGSVQEYADHFQLRQNYGIELDAILKFLGNNECANINRKENYIQYDHQNMAYLEDEIRARIKG